MSQAIPPFFGDIGQARTHFAPPSAAWTPKRERFFSKTERLSASSSETRRVSVRRIVVDIKSERFDESRDFYVGLLGFEVAMDMEWIMTFVSPTDPTAQISVLKRDATATVDADMSIEVTDVENVYVRAQRRGDAIVYPLTDEPWGVRRFFVRDPNGKVINVLSHIDAAAGFASPIGAV